ncbi:MAG: hypothetical protein U0236_14830 [Nitrospira sp.]
MKILLTVDGSDHSYEATIPQVPSSRGTACGACPRCYQSQCRVAQELYETVERNMRDDGTLLVDRTVSLLPLDAGPVTSWVVGSPRPNRGSRTTQGGADSLGYSRPWTNQGTTHRVSHRVLTFAPGAKLTFPVR